MDELVIVKKEDLEKIADCLREGENELTLDQMMEASSNLIEQKESLVEALTDIGVEASSQETFSTLVPKTQETLVDALERKRLFDAMLDNEPFDFYSDQITVLDTTLFVGSSLRSINLPECTSVGQPNTLSWNGITGPFCLATKLVSVSLPKCEKLTGVSYGNDITRYGVFVNCSSLTTLSLPECTEIHPSAAIYGNPKLTSLELPKLKVVGSMLSGGPRGKSTFANNTSLTLINFPELEFYSLGDNTYYGFFGGCTALTTVSLAKTKYIPYQTFGSLTKLSSVYAPHVQGVGYNALSGCTALTELDFPECTTLSESALYNCKNLKRLTLSTIGGSMSINSKALTGCSSLTTIIIDATFVSSVTFSACPLDIDSAKRIINCLEDYSGTENEYKNKVTFSSTTLSYLSAEGATAPGDITWTEYAKQKGWNI